jgi:hypothetical protein
MTFSAHESGIRNRPTAPQRRRSSEIDFDCPAYGGHTGRNRPRAVAVRLARRAGRWRREGRARRLPVQMNPPRHAERRAESPPAPTRAVDPRRRARLPSTHTTNPGSSSGGATHAASRRRVSARRRDPSRRRPSLHGRPWNSPRRRAPNGPGSRAAPMVPPQRRRTTAQKARRRGGTRASGASATNMAQFAGNNSTASGPVSTTIPR